MDNPKSLIIKLSAGFLSVLLFLTFFSSTIATLNLPGVVVGSPSPGVVFTTFRSFADVEFAEVDVLFAEDAGRINFAVGAGDRVSYGDVLFTIEADSEELRDRLEDEQSRLEATLVNLARARGDLAFEQSRLAQLAPEAPRPTTIHPPDTSRFEHEARRLEAEIQRAENEYSTNTLLFAAGGITQSQLDDSAHRLSQLRENYARNAEEIGIALQDHTRAIADAEEADHFAQEQHMRAIETEQSGLVHRIDTLGHSIRLLEMEEADRRRAQRRLHDQIADDGIATIYAEVDGVVREIPAGLENGMMVQRNQVVMRYANTYDSQFIVIAEFPERIGMVMFGSNVRINIPVVHQHGIQGDIVRTVTSGGRMQIEIAFETPVHINGGERAEIVIEQISNLVPPDMDPPTLPNSAIRQDMAGYYIMYLEREANTLIGYSYYVRQMRISLVHEGDRYTAFGSEEIEGPVIITSDRPFSVGSRVRIIGDE